MKHLKTYETEIYKLKYRDYVICTESSETNNKLLRYFFSENLGTFIGYHEQVRDNSICKVIFENIPNDIISYFNNENFRYFRAEDVIKATPEEIENFKLKQTSNKYNL